MTTRGIDNSLVYFIGRGVQLPTTSTNCLRTEWRITIHNKFFNKLYDNFRLQPINIMLFYGASLLKMGRIYGISGQKLCNLSTTRNYIVTLG